MIEIKSGLTFGSLTLTGHSFRRGDKKLFAEVICKCGTKKLVRWDSLTSGKCKSCGCYSAERMRTLKPATTHGLTGHPIHDIWKGMRKRCYYKNCERFQYYGGSGVKICKEWYDDFQAFYDWSIANGWEEGLQIDRFPNNEGDYEPSNCRWATDEQQRRNKTNNVKATIFGEEKCLVDWAKDPRCVVRYSVALKRIHRGWDAERAITTPAKDNGYSGSPLNKVA